MSTFTDLTLTYYDKSYNFGLEQRENNTVYSVNLDSDNPIESAEILINFAENNIFKKSTKVTGI